MTSRAAIAPVNSILPSHDHNLSSPIQSAAGMEGTESLRYLWVPYAEHNQVGPPFLSYPPHRCRQRPHGRTRRPCLKPSPAGSTFDPGLGMPWARRFSAAAAEPAERDPRERMEFDVCIVGAGPAGLSAAIRIKQVCSQGSASAASVADTWWDGFLIPPPSCAGGEEEGEGHQCLRHREGRRSGYVSSASPSPPGFIPAVLEGVEPSAALPLCRPCRRPHPLWERL